MSTTASTCAGFRCIHCGSTARPNSYINNLDLWNVGVFVLLLFAGLAACIVGVIPLMYVYTLVAHRVHYCSDCHIKLG